MSRKIVQLAGARQVLIALADDGTVWQLESGVMAWKQLPGLPDQEVTRKQCRKCLRDCAACVCIENRKGA